MTTQMESMMTALAGTTVPLRRPQLALSGAKLYRHGSVQKAVCVATPPAPTKRSKVEYIKENSGHLREPLREQLANDSTSLDEPGVQIMKFHGGYQQDNREERSFGKGKAYQFMLRTRQPAGLVTNDLYLVMDDLADEWASGTLRLTTRQAYQLHGVLKKDLKNVLGKLIRNMGSTLSACGDVNRNVMAPAVPLKEPGYLYCEEYSQMIADLLSPQGGAYYDVWVDGEKFMTSEMPEVTKVRLDNSTGLNKEGPEPIYGDVYLPRKFKICLTVPGDNSVDILTNDIGLVVITDPITGELQGFDVLVGGGMGRSHKYKEPTFARLADPLGFVAKEDVLTLCKAIVCVQRDYGRRDDRKMSRMKYLVQSWGIDKFRAKVEEYLGKPLQPFRPLPPWEFKTYLGWGEQGDGKLYYGIYVLSGRIKGMLKTTLRSIIAKYELPVRLTPNQDIILCDIDPAWKEEIEAAITAAGNPPPKDVSPNLIKSIACPALPLCGLAIGEAERALEDVGTRVTNLLTSIGIEDGSILMRITGCPNGCARPYMAELALVGDGPNSYQLWLGGAPGLSRLAEPFMDKMKINDMEKTLRPIFYLYKLRRKDSEAFGDFVSRVGFNVIRQFMRFYVPLEI